MARVLFYIDGFSSRNYIGEWSHGYGGGSPFGHREGDGGNPIPQDIVPNEGRFFGNALNGTYAIWTGGSMYVSPVALTTYTWIQAGYWMKRKLNWQGITSFDFPFYPYHTVGNQTDEPWSRGGVGGFQAGELVYRYYLPNNTSVYQYSGQYPTLPNVQDQWYWIEERVGFSISTTGVYELRINGSVVYRYTGIRTAPEGPGWNGAQFWITGYSNYTDPRYDDMYCMLGSSEGDLEWFGKSVCEPLVPVSEGDELDGTPSSGSLLYPMVDELPANDNDYIRLDTGNQKVLFGFSNMDTSRTRTVHGVKVTARAKKTGTASRKLRPICKVNGTIYSGDTVYVAPGWREIDYIWQVNPDTSSAWTATEVNGAQFGFEQVA